MKKIELQSVLPQVFADSADLQSDIWRQDVALERGHLYLVEAESGKGKSTFCSYILGYRHDYSGRVLFDDTDTQTYSVRRWVDVRMRHIAFLFQELRLFPELTAYENVKIKNDLTGSKTPQEIAAWFERLGIADHMHRRVDRMSFGQQQRVAMIRALVQPFDFLLADEPVSHLDEQNARAMGELMMEEAGRQGAGVIVTSIGKHMDLNYERILKL